MAVASGLANAFLRWGWLTPLTLPVIQLAGRAPVNVIGGLYVLWGLWTLAVTRPRFPRTPVLLYIAVLGAFALSAFGADDPGKVVRKLFKFATHTSTFPFTLMALQAGATVHRLGRVAALWGVITLAVLYALLPFAMARPDYEPTQHLEEDDLPWLTPFLVAGALVWAGRARGRLLALALAAAAVAYVVLSRGRAALLGLVASLATLLALGLRRNRLAAVTALAVLGGAALAGGAQFYRHADARLGEGVFATLDQLSSRRLTIWTRALESPPPHALTGVGLGNPKNLGTLDDEPEGWRIEALHNVLLDAWYETGLLGLAALALFLGAGLARLWRVAREAGGEERLWLAASLAGALAILTAAQFGISLTSRPFSIYLFMLLAVGWSHPGTGGR